VSSVCTGYTCVLVLVYRSVVSVRSSVRHVVFLVTPLPQNALHASAGKQLLVVQQCYHYGYIAINSVSGFCCMDKK